MPSRPSFAIALSLLLLGAGSAGAEPDPAAAAHRIAVDTNAFRAAEKLAPTKMADALAAAAQGFADYMARTDRYGHTADGREPAQRAAARGYDWCAVTENIAYVQDARLKAADPLAARFVENWQQSPPHRRNMLDADVTDTGVGIAYGAASGRWYAVQMFGLPRSAMIRFEIENRSATAVDYDIDGEHFGLAPNVTRGHERCRAAEMAVRLPGQAQAVVVVPGNGEHWRLEQAAAQLRLVRAAR